MLKIELWREKRGEELKVINRQTLSAKKNREQTLKNEIKLEQACHQEISEKKNKNKKHTHKPLDVPTLNLMGGLNHKGKLHSSLFYSILPSSG